jgi:peptide/nickel transport system ATP-binding protein
MNHDAPSPAAPPVFEVHDLAVDYGWGAGAVHAVSGVDLAVRRGEVLGLAGESGSGKSTLAYAAARLLRPPGRVVSGRVTYHPAGGPPVDVLSMGADALRRWRWEKLAIVAQASMNALNPVTTLASQLTDALQVHRPSLSASERRERAASALEMVGIPRNRMRSYAHQLSGGMRQRAIIAMALILEPEVVIMDEPTTALDVVVQRDILAQLAELTERMSLSVIFITHDLSLLLEIADTIAVMYAGSVVEHAPAAQLYHRPLHPYTAGLLRSFPSLIGPRVPLTGIPGSPPDPRHLPSGCPFHPRCPEAASLCREQIPPLVDHDGRQVACLAREDLPPRAGAAAPTGRPRPAGGQPGHAPAEQSAGDGR